MRPEALATSFATVDGKPQAFSTLLVVFYCCHVGAERAADEQAECGTFGQADGQANGGTDHSSDRAADGLAK